MAAVGSEESQARRENYRRAMLEAARQALRDLALGLDRPGGSRVVGTVAATGDPATLVIRIEIPLGGQWVTLVTLSAEDLGMPPDDIAEEIKLIRYQSGVGIPDDLSDLDGI